MTDIATTDHDAERVSMSDSEGGDEHDTIDSEDDDLAHDAGDNDGGDRRRAKDAENKNITREERLRRSRERNREHARRTRLRNKAQMATMQQRVAELQAESVALRQRIEVRVTRARARRHAPPHARARHTRTPRRARAFRARSRRHARARRPRDTARARDARAFRSASVTRPPSRRRA